MLEYLGDILYYFMDSMGRVFCFYAFICESFSPKDLVISRIAFFIGCVVRSRLSKTLTRLDIVDS